MSSRCSYLIKKQQRKCFETGVLYNLITLRQLLPIHTYTHVFYPYIDTRPRELFMHSTTTPLTHTISNTLKRLSFQHPVPINLVVHTSIYQRCHLDISPASNPKYSVKEVRCGGLSGIAYFGILLPVSFDQSIMFTLHLSPTPRNLSNWQRNYMK